MFALYLQESSSSILVLCVIGVFILFFFTLTFAALRVVPEYARIAVFRLGRFVGIMGPGLVFLLPLVDRGIQVDLRGKKGTFQAEASSQENTPLKVQVSLNYHIIEPEKSILNVPNLSQAIHDITQTGLKSILGGMTYGDILHHRARVEQELRNRLEKGLQIWGCELTSLELIEVTRL
ncbi:MAG: SPFH/Band 7/PHB domain protein [Anaerolineales bacterium]|nr:SPFH/Band 7/PHB domain protein [Anaerolineales bacterium]